MVQGNLGKEGIVTLNAPNARPCLVALYNPSHKDFNIQVIGNNVGNYHQSFRYSRNPSQNVQGGDFTIKASDDVTFLYVGSTSGQE